MTREGITVYLLLIVIAVDLASVGAPQKYEGTKPTFHEQRWLSERFYRDQVIDTQKLLGHRSNKMTDKYNDDRGKDWVVIGVKSA